MINEEPGKKSISFSLGKIEKFWMLVLLWCKLILLFSNIYKHPILVLSDSPKNSLALSSSSLKDKKSFEKTKTFESFPIFLYFLILSISSLFITEPLNDYKEFISTPVYSILIYVLKLKGNLDFIKWLFKTL